MLVSVHTQVWPTNTKYRMVIVISKRTLFLVNGFSEFGLLSRATPHMHFFFFSELEPIGALE